MEEQADDRQPVSGRSHAVHSWATAPKPHSGIVVVTRRILPAEPINQPRRTSRAVYMESATNGHQG